MKKYFKGLIIIFLFFPKHSVSGDMTFTDGLWTSSYDCPDWIQTTVPETYCGYEASSSYCAGPGTVPCAEDDNSKAAHIEAAANNPAGVPGSGAHIHYFATNPDGSPIVNDKSSSLRVSFPSPVQEFWWRFYVYYPTTSINTGWKIFRVVDTNGENIWTAQPYDSNRILGMYFPYGSGVVATNYYTASWMEENGRQGYGNWLPIEIYLKNDTDGTDGIFRVWWGTELILNRTDINTGLVNFKHIDIASNGNGIASNIGGALVGIRIDDNAVALPTYAGFVDDGNGYSRIGLIYNKQITVGSGTKQVTTTGTPTKQIVFH